MLCWENKQMKPLGNMNKCLLNIALKRDEYNGVKSDQYDGLKKLRGGNRSLVVRCIMQHFKVLLSFFKNPLLTVIGCNCYTHGWRQSALIVALTSYCFISVSGGK